MENNKRSQKNRSMKNLFDVTTGRVEGQAKIYNFGCSIMKIPRNCNKDSENVPKYSSKKNNRIKLKCENLNLVKISQQIRSSERHTSMKNLKWSKFILQMRQEFRKFRGNVMKIGRKIRIAFNLPEFSLRGNHRRWNFLQNSDQEVKSFLFYYCNIYRRQVCHYFFRFRKGFKKKPLINFWNF